MSRRSIRRGVPRPPSGAMESVFGQDVRSARSKGSRASLGRFAEDTVNSVQRRKKRPSIFQGITGVNTPRQNSTRLDRVPTRSSNGRTRSSASSMPSEVALVPVDGGLSPSSSISGRLEASGTLYGTDRRGHRSEIAVGVRLRPLLEQEEEKGEEIVWEVDEARGTIQESLPSSLAELAEAPEPHSFPCVFGPTTSTATVYDRLAAPIVRAALDGYNGTVFAYGQTGSGKTYSLLGTESDPGITVLAIHELFRAMESREDVKFDVRVSYLEIYNEELRDLLAPHDDEDLGVVDSALGPMVKNLTEEMVTTPRRALELLRIGEEHRRVAATALNQRSSRSHTVFRVVIESRPRVEEELERTMEGDGQLEFGEKGPVASVLNLVDLAGSESVKKSGATGSVARESGQINVSLLTLGTVIADLVNGSPHIAYRRSKLTRLLSASLGGNAQTAVVVTVSPARSHAGETRSSLAFAARTRRVVNVARVNEVPDANTLLSSYRREIARLRAALLEGRGGLVATSDGRLLPATRVVEELRRQFEVADAAREDAERQIEELVRNGERSAGVWKRLLLVGLHALGHLDTAGEVVKVLADAARGEDDPEHALERVMGLPPGFRDGVSSRLVGRLLSESGVPPEDVRALGASPPMRAALTRMGGSATPVSSSERHSVASYFSPENFASRLSDLLAARSSLEQGSRAAEAGESAARAACEAAERRARDAEEALEALTRQYHALQSSASRAAEKAEEDVRLLRQAREDGEVLRRRVKALEEGRALLSADVARAEETAAEARREAELQVEAARKEVESERRRAQEAAAHTGEAAGAAAAARHAQHAAEERLAEAQKITDDAKKRATQALQALDRERDETERLRRESQAGKAELEAATRRIEILEGELAAANLDLQTKEGDMHDLQREADRVSDLEQRLEEADARVLALQSQLEAAHSRAVQLGESERSLDVRLERERERAAEHESRADHAEERVRRISAAADDLQDRLERTNVELDELRSKSELLQSEAETFQSQLQSARDAQQSLESELVQTRRISAQTTDDFRRTERQLRSQLDETSRNLQKTLADLESLQSHHAALQTRHSSLEADHLALQQSLESRTADRSAALEAAEAQSSRVAAALAKAQERLSLLEQRLERSDREERNLRQKLADSETEKREIRSQHETDRRSALAREERHAADIVALRKKVAQLEEDLAEAQAQTTLARIHSLDRENRKTSSQLDVIREQLASARRDLDDAASVAGSTASFSRRTASNVRRPSPTTRLPGTPRSEHSHRSPTSQ